MKSGSNDVIPGAKSKQLLLTGKHETSIQLVHIQVVLRFTAYFSVLLQRLIKKIARPTMRAGYFQKFGGF